jgi:hypothetical protein
MEQLKARERDARTKLRAALAVARKAADDVAAATELARRGATELASIQAELRSAQQFDNQTARELEQALREGRPAQAKANGTDHQQIKAMLAATEQAAEKFDAELADANRRRSEAMDNVKAAARNVLCSLMANAAESLHCFEDIASRIRLGLVSLSEARAFGSLEPLKLDPATAEYIAAPPVHFTEHPVARSMSRSSWVVAWQEVFQRLIDGDTEAEFPREWMAKELGISDAPN